MPMTHSCPYCNSTFALGEVPADRRVVCPRCGDAFPLRGEPEASAPATITTTATLPSASQRTSGLGAVRWYLIGFLVPILGILALFGWSRFFGDSSPVRGPGGMPLPKGRPDVIEPVALQGVKYLRPDSNLVLAVQSWPVLQHATRTGRDPVAMLEEMGVPRTVFATLDRAGVTLEQIDHIAVGATVGDQVLEVPPLTLVLVLREPVADVDRFLKAFDARRTRVGDRTVHQVNLGGLTGLLLWQATPTIWTFALREADLPTGMAERGPLSTECRELVSQKAAAWVVVGEADWSKKPAVRFLADLRKKPAWLTMAEKLRMATIDLSLADASPRLGVFVRVRDDDTGERLRQALPDAKGKGPAVWVVHDGDPADGLGKIARTLEDTLKP